MSRRNTRQNYLINIVYPDRLIFPHIGAEKWQNKVFLHLCLKKKYTKKI